MPLQLANETGASAQLQTFIANHGEVPICIGKARAPKRRKRAPIELIDGFIFWSVQLYSGDAKSRSRLVHGVSVGVRSDVR